MQTIRDKDVYLSLGLFLLLAFGYFFFVGNYVLFFQETQSLFVFSEDYIRQHLLKPGAPLEYAAKFLTQFYAGRFTGTVILSVILGLSGLILFHINKKLIPGISLSLLLLILVPYLLFLLQANYYHMMEYNLGIILILLVYLGFISPGKKHDFLLIAFYPVIYFVGGAYALIFGCMYIVHNMFIEPGSRKYILSLLMLTIGAISFFISLKFIFLQPYEQLLLFPLPLLENPGYRITFIILVAYLVFYPLLCKMALRLRGTRMNRRSWCLIPVAVVIFTVIFSLFTIYNPQTARVIELERLAFNEKWEDAISLHEKRPSLNLIGQYFYNYSLSESGQLCDRLFFGRQDFGSGSLVLPWGDEHLNRGAYFYYSVGLINEAHRWAYEEMVVYGYRPQNLQLLVKTSLINGDYTMAKKYSGILKKTIYYRKQAKKFEKLADNPDLITTDPELGEKQQLLPKTNFFVQFNIPQNNLPLILGSQPDNRRAFEYYISGLLLTKNVNEIVPAVARLKSIGYTRIPRHIEEAILIYYNSTGIFPDLGGLSLTNETRARFDSYFAAYMEARNNPATLEEEMARDFSNTFWYYFHFK